MKPMCSLSLFHSYNLLISSEETRLKATRLQHKGEPSSVTLAWLNNTFA